LQRAEYEAYNTKLQADVTEAASMAPSLDKAARASAAALLTVSDEQLRREYDEWLHAMDQDLLDEAIDELQDDSPPPSPKTKPASLPPATKSSSSTAGAPTKSVTIVESVVLEVV
jgi:hypothetical protein